MLKAFKEDLARSNQEFVKSMSDNLSGYLNESYKQVPTDMLIVLIKTLK